GWLREASHLFGDRIMVASDAKGDEVDSHGWQTNTGLNLYEAAFIAEEYGASSIIYTDVSREGRLLGPNVVEYFALTGSADVGGNASGGIRNREDIDELADAEVDGVILGTAAYTGQIALKELFDSTE